MNALAHPFAEANAGPLFEAEIVSLRLNAKLRVTYNWLYSALNCDPDDASPFAWTIYKHDDTHIAFGPRDPFGGRRLYASVRDDNNWFVQTQAPFSAHWITAIGRDEIITMTALGLQLVRLAGFNNQFIAVDPTLTRHDAHAGFRLRSIGSPVPESVTWFLSITSVLQPQLRVPTRDALTREDLRAALTSAGLEAGEQTIDNLQRLLS